MPQTSSRRRTVTHAARDQHLHFIQRMRIVRRTFVKGLFQRQFQQRLVNNLLLGDVINPELAATPGMFSNVAAILTGNGNFHLQTPSKT
jgi:hypothetical protein